jgi:hypothetical protein
VRKSAYGAWPPTAKTLQEQRALKTEVPGCSARALGITTLSTGQRQRAFKRRYGDNSNLTGGNDMEPLQFNIGWPKEFGYLKQFGMGEPFRLILALARSARDLEHLHSLLREDCQLPRKELVKLCEFWQRLWGGQVPREGQRLGDGVVKAMLDYSCPDAGLRTYYRSLLLKDRVREERCWAHWHSKVHHEDALPRHNKRSLFVLKFKGLELEFFLDLYKSYNGSEIGIQIYTTNGLLTEKTTHFLLTLQLATTYGTNTGLLDPHPETVIDFWIMVPRQTLDDCLGNFDSVEESPYITIFAKAGLTERLSAVLTELGLPVESVVMS